MTSRRTTDKLAAALHVSVRLLVHRIRQTQPVRTELTMPETSALSRLDRRGPTTAAEMARAEQISPQSMAATIASLEARGLVGRAADPNDGRRSPISLTAAGLAELRNRRDNLTRTFADALSAEFTDDELDRLAAAVPLIERLAERI